MQDNSKTLHFHVSIFRCIDRVIFSNCCSVANSELLEFMSAYNLLVSINNTQAHGRKLACNCFRIARESILSEIASNYYILCSFIIFTMEFTIKIFRCKIVVAGMPNAILLLASIHFIWIRIFPANSYRIGNWLIHKYKLKILFRMYASWAILHG